MMSTVQTSKQAMRKMLKDRIAKLTEKEKAAQSQIVSEKVLKSPEYQKCQRISVFLSMKDEICTETILQNIFHSKRDCFIPKYNKENMKMVRLKSWEDYETLPLTKWNIKQPAIGEFREDALETGGLDMILMPGLAFTTQGFRLGRGKGYYDNYLKLCHSKGFNPLTIALAFSQQVVDDVPMTDDDVPVKYVFYPEHSEIQKAYSLIQH